MSPHSVAGSDDDRGWSSESVNVRDSAELLPTSHDLREALEDEAATLDWKENSIGKTWQNYVLVARRWIFKNDVGGSDSFANAWMRKALVAGSYILAWYTTSLVLSLYNKWLFSEDHYNFKFPLFTTMIHMIMQFSLSGVAVAFIWPRMRPARHPAVKDYFTKVLPCGVATGMDIGLSNSSLKVISLSFYTMVKSGAPVFVLLFAFLFGLERPTWTLSGVIIVICFGVFLMVLNETEFNWAGYVEVQIATVLSGLRWALTQMLLERESMGMNNPLATNLFLAPLMALSLLIACSIIEGIPTVFQSPFFATFGSTLSILGAIFLGGSIAFLMVVSEFFLISTTSVVTFSIAGILKEIITIIAAAKVFGDEFPANKIVGLIISISGIAGYNYMRIRHMRKKHRAEARKTLGPFQESVEEDEEDEDTRLVAAGRGLYGFHPVNAIAGSRPSREEELDLGFMGYDDLDLNDDPDSL
ncbi:hypothetical protein SpCBS45565_g01327 [Spizellomyces sp. 'palustris']|nr:hypothetical protein SpCBS45565_g01327 [Spizellomyces sp. 'palustris']